MGTTSLIFMLAATIAGSPISKVSAERQEKYFQKYWGTDFVWKFDELPTKGMVPKQRIPYSGYIYLDNAGGTTAVMRKYDMAFHRGRYLATSWERADSSQPGPRSGGGLFGWFTSGRTPSWYGHCNGWAAATIRHAEPKKSVVRNGVTFTPADIKGLLAEIYIYNDVLDLVGNTTRLNAGTFHAILANWVGRGSHALGLEADPGEQKWNYPLYSFASSYAKRGSRRVEVKTNIAYIKDSYREYTKSPRYRRIKYFHYMLDLNQKGQIVGGQFMYDSSMIDMLWVPLRPKPSRQRGNENGNPYVNVDTVLAIWRDSVDEATRKTWLTIDPAPEDRVLEVAADVKSLLPVQDVAAGTLPTIVAAKVEESEKATEEKPEENPASTAESSDAKPTDVAAATESN